MRTGKRAPFLDLAYHDLTPLDIAREMKSSNLIEILSPVIHHPIPHRILARLQALFHEMIRADLEDVEALRLPDLTPLTELRSPEMWFPIRNHSDKLIVTASCFPSLRRIFGS